MAKDRRRLFASNRNLEVLRLARQAPFILCSYSAHTLRSVAPTRGPEAGLQEINGDFLQSNFWTVSSGNPSDWSAFQRP
jgi:hypothetical protein